MEKFYDVFTHTQMQNYLKQNQESSSLRNWLLPMLMNGHERVIEKSGAMGMAANGEREAYKKLVRCKLIIK